MEPGTKDSVCHACHKHFPMSKGIKKHRCDLCGKCLTNAKSCRRHKKTTLGIEEIRLDLQCHFCDATFHRESALEEHLTCHIR